MSSSKRYYYQQGKQIDELKLNQNQYHKCNNDEYGTGNYETIIYDSILTKQNIIN